MTMQTTTPVFAKRVFFWAGVYGLIVLLPQYFMEQRIGLDYPPAITHPEHFYGFIGLAVAWQLAFLAISRDPLRLRPVMLAAVVEKYSFAIPTAVLLYTGRAPWALAPLAGIDATLGVLFLVSYWRCRETR
jgi:hypothetical protein